MKNDVVMYQMVYHILKNKIQCGLLPTGARLPSRADLCSEFSISEKTARRAVNLLASDGLIQVDKRKRPTVIFNPESQPPAAQPAPQEADSAAVDDLYKTGLLLCYPLNKHGMVLCSGAEWDIPEAIVRNMDPDNAEEFWRSTSRLWRFFIARNGNELILRAVDNLGFGDIKPLSNTPQIRTRYQESLKTLISTMRQGNPEHASFDHLFLFCNSLTDPLAGNFDCHVPAGSSFRIDAAQIEQRILGSQERYSNVYMDLLGLIVIGRYRPGDRLPSHEELQEIYGVSIDTTLKAVQILQELGAVTATRGKGIFVTMDLERLKGIQLDPHLIACHLRRFLDSLELLSLTIEGVAAHAASHITAEAARQLYDDMDRLWNEYYIYQRSPRILLNFITNHIQYSALKAVYRVICQNYWIGRSIPKLVTPAKNPANCKIYRLCMDAAGLLIAGEPQRFARQAAEAFYYTQQMVISECGKLGYLESAMAVYDGSLLWK